MSLPSQEIGLEQLAGEARAGCSASFDELARRVSPALLSFLRRRSPGLHDAEDLRQETLLRAYQNLRSYDPSRPFGPWLMTIAARLAANRHGGKPAPEPLRHDVIDNELHADRAAGEREAGAFLWTTAAKALPATQYRALRLRYVEQLGVREIAAAMGISITSAKVLLFRARRRLMALRKVKALLEAPPQGGEDSHEL